MADVPQPRTLVLCFDGTGNKFGENSNVVRFVHMLRKDVPTQQLIYYQAGIGTYVKRQFFTQTLSKISTMLDSAIALNLGEHVKDGYKYLMQNYRDGDKICLLGFSRGAYTARALAGMLYKVGLLQRDNEEQVDFAFSIYQSTDRLSSKLSRQFKDIFSIDVTVEFVGVWDTVSSVGIIPRQLPYSTISYGLKTFRHALALDERRARFRPSIWNEPNLVVEELDDDPVLELRPEDQSRDDWEYKPPQRRPVDAAEVWFAGCHADVGGGSHGTDEKDSLSSITLRWMIKECFVAQTGIVFNVDHLEALGLSYEALTKDPASVLTASGNSIPKGLAVSPESTLNKALKMIDMYFPGMNFALKDKYFSDAVAPVYNQLELVRYWWILELLPLLGTYQQEDGTWFRQRRRNFGNGRYMPHSDHEIKVHVSVLERIRQTAAGNNPYTPAAYNWHAAIDGGLVKWVD